MSRVLALVEGQTEHLRTIPRVSFATVQEPRRIRTSERGVRTEDIRIRERPIPSEIEQGGLTDTNDYGTSTCIQVAAAPGPRAGRQATVPLGEELHLPEAPLEPLAPARNTGGEGSDPCC